MSDLGYRHARALGLMVLSVMVCVLSARALAVPVADYVTVQPIDVCSGAAGTSTGCAPINSLGQNYKTAAVGAIGPVASGTNVTRAIWNQIGLDITFLPAVQDPNAGGFLNLSVDAGSNPLTSTQFQTLSDQSGISQGLPPTPSPPLSQNPSTINMFFVNKLVPTTPGTLYGFSWVNNNGVAIASNSLLGAGARPDTVAHELGHNLGLNHTTFGAGSPSNLMTAGDARALSTVSNVLSNLNSGVADQLNSLQAMAVLDPTGFLNPIPEVSATVTAPTATGGPFRVSFDPTGLQPGRPGEFLSTLTLTAPTGVVFQPSTFHVIGSTAGLVGQVTCVSPCSGGSVLARFPQGSLCRRPELKLCDRGVPAGAGWLHRRRPQSAVARRYLHLPVRDRRCRGERY